MWLKYKVEVESRRVRPRSIARRTAFQPCSWGLPTQNYLHLKLRPGMRRLRPPGMERIYFHDRRSKAKDLHVWYRSTKDLIMGDRFQVKKIEVRPGAKLSLQKHFHRAEHWVVVSGTAIVRRDGEEIMLRENESVYLPLGCIHRMENPGKIPLTLIEVQSGSYLGEDDIVRFEDTYGRL